jgi:Protein of unknown function DUF262
MQINNNNYSVIELINMLEQKTLIVNRDYQRGPGLWPPSARSYFVDTIMQSFPFPKIYMYEYLDRPARGVMREIVDGQQRMTAILGFYNNEFALQSEGVNKGKKFRDLDEESQAHFLSYSVSVDVIRSASMAQILQMFRRMNAYTTPLNDAEKRHSGFNGKFKWFINDLADELNEFFVDFGVFTPKQITRMGDATLISDCILGIERGVISTSASDLRALYEKYDVEYELSGTHREIILSTMDFIASNFGELRRSFMMKPYALHSLFTALAFNRFGNEAISRDWNVSASGDFTNSVNISRELLVQMSLAHEGKETEGRFATYVWGCLSTVDRRPRRTARAASIMRAIGISVSSAVDANLS